MTTTAVTSRRGELELLLAQRTRFAEATLIAYRSAPSSRAFEMKRQHKLALEAAAQVQRDLDELTGTPA